MQATIKQLRRETGAVVRAVERGETVIVTYRGKPVAEISAVGQAAKPKEAELFGIWKDNNAVASVEKYVTKLRKGRIG
jgi:antitoxin (DNA-binding transcriptional repressor) of toxin-antitoxin stability system